MKISRITTRLGLVAVGAVLAGSGTAVAATGGNFLLGKSNYAGATTALRNTGTGVVLSLPSYTPGQVPLYVSPGSGKVRNLDADKLDGLSSATFARVGGQVGRVEAPGVLVDLDEDGTNDAVEAYAACPAGSKVTGGGFEVFTASGALVNRAEGNGWLVVSLPDEDGATLAEDVVAAAQCYDPRGAITGAVERFSTQAATSRTSDDERTKLLRAAARR